MVTYLNPPGKGVKFVPPQHPTKIRPKSDLKFDIQTEGLGTNTKY